MSVEIGTIDTGYSRRAVISIDAKYRDGRLSISASAKRPGASDIDLGGQMQDTLREALEGIQYAPGWNQGRLAEVLDIWDRWHLNDMRAGCEHQRASWDVQKPLTIWTWVLDRETAALQRAAKADAWRRLENGEAVLLDAETRELVALAYTVKTTTDQPPPHYEAPSPGSSVWAPSETKNAGWVRPAEHPEGLLTAPCPECGYLYGSAWLKEEVPAEVLAALAAALGRKEVPA